RWGVAVTNVGERWAHVVEQEIGVWQEDLEAQRPYRARSGHKRGHVARGTPDPDEDHGPRPPGKVERQPRRRSQEVDEAVRRVELALRELWLGADEIDAVRAGGAVEGLLGQEAGMCDSHLHHEGPRVELGDGRLLRLAP